MDETTKLSEATTNEQASPRRQAKDFALGTPSRNRTPTVEMSPVQLEELVRASRYEVTP